MIKTQNFIFKKFLENYLKNFQKINNMKQKQEIKIKNKINLFKIKTKLMKKLLIKNNKKINL